MKKSLFTWLLLVSSFAIVGFAENAKTLTECRVDCPPRDDQSFLQSILDACPTDAICEFPKGIFTLSAPLRVHKSTTIRGAGGGPGRRSGKRVTEIRIAERIKSPAFAIEGVESDIEVSIGDMNLIGGGIKVGGQKDPCRGIDDPFDIFNTDLALKDISIIASLPEAIRFEGGSLTLEDVKVADDLEGAGLYIANALGNITIIDAEFVGNERWGIYICNMEGTGQIFMDDVSAYQNGRGGIAIVGKGSAPSFKTVCLQNIGASFNHRFGILLYDVAKTLLFNIAAGLTSSESSSFSFFGNGIAVSASDDVYLWNVTATLNEGAGYLAYGPSSTETTHLHMVGDIYGLNNTIPFAVLDGDAFLHEYTSPSQISGLCGFTSPITAPPTNAYCEKNLQPVPCTAERVDLAPPAPIQDP